MSVNFFRETKIRLLNWQATREKTQDQCERSVAQRKMQRRANSTRRKKAKDQDVDHDACYQHKLMNEYRRTMAGCALAVGMLACISLAYFGLELNREMTELYGVTERNETTNSGMSDEERFLDWFHVAGGVNGKVGIQAFPDMGKGESFHRAAMRLAIDQETVLE